MSAASSSMQDSARTIRDMEAEFARKANAGDAAALTEGYYADGAQLLPPNAPTVQGKAAIRQFWEMFLAMGSTDIRMETANVSASGDLAYSTGSYGHTVNGVRHSGKYMVVYQRQADGGYQAVADSFSDNQ